MKEITIKVPNRSHSKEWEVLDAVEKLLTYFEKQGTVVTHQGQGGTLDDWKTKDLNNPDGLLMVFTVKQVQKTKEKEGSST